MFEQQNPNGYFQYQGFQQPNQMAKISNSLTKEEIERLQKNVSQFSLAITEDERLRGICTHRSLDGATDALVEDENGLLRCTICGYQFKAANPDTTADQIQDAVNDIVDYLQTTKLMFMDLPQEAAREYYQIIPLIEKLPQLFEMAAKNMAKHDAAFGWNYQNPNMSSYSMFQNLANVFGGGMMGQAQPIYPQQPQPNPAFMGGAPAGYPNAAYGPSNGFGYPQGYNPQNNGFAYTPTTPGAAQPTIEQGTVDSTASETTVQQNVKA